jgi:hypothetical protein
MPVETPTARARLVLRVALWSLAALAAMTGVIATLAPHTFYESFPAGLGLVEKLPPYNQHLVTDVGGFYLAFTLLFAWTAVTLQRAVMVPVALAWIVVQSIHTAYHLLHLDGFDVAEGVAQTAGFAIFLLLPAVVLALRGAGDGRG